MIREGKQQDKDEPEEQTGDAGEGKSDSPNQEEKQVHQVSYREVVQKDTNDDDDDDKTVGASNAADNWDNAFSDMFIGENFRDNVLWVKISETTSSSSTSYVALRPKIM